MSDYDSIPMLLKAAEIFKEPFTADRFRQQSAKAEPPNKISLLFQQRFRRYLLQIGQPDIMTFSTIIHSNIKTRRDFPSFPAKSGGKTANPDCNGYRYP